MCNNIKRLLKKSIKSRTVLQDIFFFFMYKMKFVSKYTAGIMSMDRTYYKLEKKYSKYVNKIKLEDYTSNKSNIIWICWLQGMENAPEIVKICYESVVENFENKYEIIVITKDNYSNFVELPKYIIEKFEKGIINVAHFSDILRLELLVKYGGLWLDATVYCSGNKEIENFENMDLFVYRNGWLDMENINIGNWLIYAKSNNKILNLTLKLLYKYWSQKNYAENYFIFHMFFKMATDRYKKEWEEVLYFSQLDNHLLSKYLESDILNEKSYNNIISKTDFHKLSYKSMYKNIIITKEK